MTGFMWLEILWSKSEWVYSGRTNKSKAGGMIPGQGEN